MTQIQKAPTFAGYTRETAEQVLQNNLADAVSFGSAFLANPDLPQRFEHNAGLNAPEQATFYGGDAKGYTDYPFLHAEQYKAIS